MTRQPWKRDVAALLIAATALVWSSAYVWTGGAQSPVVEVVATPGTWVPFSATVTQSDPNWKTDVVGRFFRGSDGSSRLETGPPDRPDAVVSINNAAQRRMYIGRKGGGVRPDLDGWRVANINSDWFHVPGFRVDNVRWFRHPEKIEGFDVLRWVDPRGTVHLHAPALNGETVVRQGADGARRVLSRIKIGEQPADLFMPPPNVAVREVSKEQQERLDNPTLITPEREPQGPQR